MHIAAEPAQRLDVRGELQDAQGRRLAGEIGRDRARSGEVTCEMLKGTAGRRPSILTQSADLYSTTCHSAAPRARGKVGGDRAR